ncbi:Protein disulfide-isomerase A6 [Tupaia chinensis]|uniref:Protein disulfide-isomerase A6 n=1 Tax=Tupaia chinensis TaxID=246437 RepID=L9LAS8_TUPCH|nr:Protein disulfide-isomerase A6 [Tupaia chinensis]
MVCFAPAGLVSCTFFLAVNGLYSSSDDVIELTPSNFNREVIQSDSLWLVEFYAPWCGHCQRLTPEWKKAATALKDVVKVGAVDADKHQSLGGQYGVQGFPTIKIFGSNKNRPEDYQGGRTGEAIVDAALSALRQLVKDRLGGRSGGYSSGKQGGSESPSKKDVIELTDDSFDKNVLDSGDVWMVEFYAPWCGHCKNLEPEWASAATEVKEQTKGKVKLAAVDATVNQGLASRYGIRGFPTIKIFQRGESPVDYDGGRTRSDIVARALDLFSDNAPPPELLEIVNEDVAKKTCEEHQLCVVAVLPHILDTAQSDLESAVGMGGFGSPAMAAINARKMKFALLKGSFSEQGINEFLRWLWTEAGAQSDLESALGIGGFGYPAMAAINARKMKFALLKGSFSEQGINEFLRELSFGRGSTAPVGGGAFPAIFEREPWDGRDGELPVEDDIDLSDVELDDLGKDEL